MTVQGSITTGYRGRSTERTPVDLLRLEQEDWLPGIGQVSSLAAAQFMRNLLYGQSNGVRVDCGINGDSYSTVIYAYPLRPGVQYRIAASRGAEIGPGEYEEAEMQAEIINWQLERSQTLRYPATSIIDMEWLAGPWGANGEAVSSGLRLHGDVLQAQAPLAGILRIAYRSSRYSHLLTVPRRDDPEAELVWDCWVMACPPPGRPVLLEVQPPPGAEALSASGMECGYSFSGSVAGPDDGPRPPTIGKRRKTDRFDYCTQEYLGSQVS